MPGCIAVMYNQAIEVNLSENLSENLFLMIKR